MNYFWAFVTGGAICVVGQLFLDLTALTPARILTGYVVAGVVLSALGWYAPLAEFAGCGATVPLLGFGHLLAKGVRTALAEEGAIGILTGGLTAAAAGITTLRAMQPGRWACPLRGCSGPAAPWPRRWVLGPACAAPEWQTACWP